MGIYTKTGDKGKTGLLDGTRVYKSDTRIEAYGTVDEVVSAIALARSFALKEEVSEILKRVERELFFLASELAIPEPRGTLKNTITEEHIAWLENKIDKIMTKTSLNNDFIVPGPYKSSASIHMARTIARRAERQAVRLDLEVPIRREILVYLNRLSDLLFALAKYQEEEETIKKAMEKIGTNLGMGSAPRKITLDIAKTIIKAAEEKAKEIAIPMVISVVDSGGHLVAFHRMDGALLASSEISINKAHTSVAFKSPTSDLDDLARPEGELYGVNTLNDGKYVTFGGGFPISSGNEIIGAIGVSGGTVQEDMTVAKAGLKIIAEGS